MASRHQEDPRSPPRILTTLFLLVGLGLLLLIVACPNRGGSGNGPRPAVMLTLQPGPSNPALRDAPECSAGVAVLQFELVVSDEDDVLVESVGFVSSGTGNEAIDVTAAYLYVDIDGDGIAGPSDTRIGGPTWYTADDGTVTVSGLGRTLPASARELWILVYDFSGSVSPGSTFQARVASNADVIASSVQTGGAATVTGAPVMGGVVTIVDPALISAFYQDGNENGLVDPGDLVRLVFNVPVQMQGTPSPGGVIVMNPSGSFGAGAVMTPGSSPNEIDLLLQIMVSLQPNGIHAIDPGSTGINLNFFQTAINACPGTPVPQAPVHVDLAGESNPRAISVGLADANQSCSLDAGDTLDIAFTTNVTLTTADPSQAFQLPVSGDSFGGGAAFLSGPMPTDVGTVTVILGTAPVLEALGAFDPGVLSPGSSSGVAVSAMPGRIVDARYPSVSAVPHAAPGVDVTALPPVPLWTSVGDDQWGAEFGHCVAPAGDVDGDGYGDVVIGAHRFRTTNLLAGKAYLYLGGPGGLAPSPAWTSSGDDLLSSVFGSSVASAGDVNGDGYSDVIVGAPWQDSVLGNHGAVYLYHGGPGGLSASPAWTSTGDTQGDAVFGWQVASAGDVNNDGFSDAIVGAPEFDVNFPFSGDEGKAYVYLGGPAGLAPSPAWTASGDVRSSAAFGQAVASAGDVNGDGYDDVIVGAPRHDAAGFDAGKAFLYLGGPSGLGGAEAWMSGGDDQREAVYGFSVASAGDVDQDGYSDIIVGTYDSPASVTQGQGKAFLYPGSASGPALVATWTSSGGGSQNSFFGYSLSGAGDVDQDGFPDVIIGAPAAWSANDNGDVYVFLGGASGLSLTAAWARPAEQNASMFGLSVAAAGDTDGDGIPEVLVGAGRFDNLPNSSTGKAFLFRVCP